MLIRIAGSSTRRLDSAIEVFPRSHVSVCFDLHHNLFSMFFPLLILQMHCNGNFTVLLPDTTGFKGSLQQLIDIYKTAYLLKLMPISDS